MRKVNQDVPLEAPNLFAVADGMGGHVGGEVAARVAVDTLLAAFTREPTTAGLRDAFTEANEAVWLESQANSDLRGMGTTLTAVALVGGADGHDILALGNVGDSRAYIFSEGQIVQVTADHSLAEERARHGELTEEEAAVHPQRHILTRALGVSSDVETDMWELQLRSGDRIVLCSDGLSNEIGMDDLAQVLLSVADPDEAAHQLVDAANERGGADNITVVVVDVLVGEDDTNPTSVVTPLRTRVGGPPPIPEVAGAVAAVAAGLPAPPARAVPGVAPSAPQADETSVVPQVDALAPGARLGFSGQGTDLGADGPGSGEFFLGNTGTVPVARSTTRVPVAPRPGAARPPAKESRGARRRRLGIPRRVTLRVVAFVIFVAAVPVGAFYAIRWYAYDNWYLAVQGHEIVIKQGHLGGVLWFNPRVVVHSDLTASFILPQGMAQIRAGVQEPTLADAQHYLDKLYEQYLFQHPGSKPVKGSAQGTIGPSGVLPNITEPSTTTSTSSTVPGQTTAPAGSTPPT
jgi:protein phosphatase